MTISQSEKELAAAFETARQLKEKINENYILKTGNNKNLPEEIMQFIKSNREIISRYIENKTTTTDIILAQIMKQFLFVYKILNSKKQPGKFFRHNQDTAQLENHLKIIKEELNKLPSKSEVKPEYQTKSFTLGA